MLISQEARMETKRKFGNADLDNDDTGNLKHHKKSKVAVVPLAWHACKIAPTDLPTFSPNSTSPPPTLIPLPDPIPLINSHPRLAKSAPHPATPAAVQTPRPPVVKNFNYANRALPPSLTPSFRSPISASSCLPGVQSPPSSDSACVETVFVAPASTSNAPVPPSRAAAATDHIATPDAQSASAAAVASVAPPSSPHVASNPPPPVSSRSATPTVSPAVHTSSPDAPRPRSRDPAVAPSHPAATSPAHSLHPRLSPSPSPSQSPLTGLAPDLSSIPLPDHSPYVPPREESAALVAEFHSLEREASDLSSKRRTLVYKLNKHVAATRAQNVSLCAAGVVLTEDLRVAQVDLRAVRLENTELHSQISKLGAQIVEQRADRTAMSYKMAGAATASKALEKENARMAEEIGELVAQQGEWQRDLDGVRDVLAQERERMELLIETLKAELSGAKSDLASVIEDQANHSDAMLREIDVLKVELGQAREALEDMAKSEKEREESEAESRREEMASLRAEHDRQLQELTRRLVAAQPVENDVKSARPVRVKTEREDDVIDLTLDCDDEEHNTRQDDKRTYTSGQREARTNDPADRPRRPSHVGPSSAGIHTLRLTEPQIEILWESKTSCNQCAHEGTRHEVPLGTNLEELAAHSEARHPEICNMLIEQTQGLNREQIMQYFNDAY